MIEVWINERERKMNTYLTIDEQDEEYIINVEISDSEKIDRNKLNKTIKQISKFIKKNDKKRKDVIINTSLDLENISTFLSGTDRIKIIINITTYPSNNPTIKPPILDGISRITVKSINF